MQEIIRNALQIGNETLLEYFGRIHTTQVKENQSSIVTEADIRSEQNIVAYIRSQFPEHSIIAEETGFLLQDSTYTWIIDPLDGTSNFAVGIPWFGVLIALLKDWEPVAAGMSLPYFREYYLAELGKGAFRNGEPIRVSPAQSLKEVLFAYSLDYSADPARTQRETDIIFRLVQRIRNLRSTNSAVDFCYTADGRLGGCLNQTTRIWDIAAPYLIVREAGGLLTTAAGAGLDFRSDAGNYDRNFTVLAASPALHPQILALVQP
jgi:myo-inositol-1(or 4)-monophosphatase